MGGADQQEAAGQMLLAKRAGTAGEGEAAVVTSDGFVECQFRAFRL